jgi:hypothetical protein
MRHCIEALSLALANAQSGRVGAGTAQADLWHIAWRAALSFWLRRFPPPNAWRPKAPDSKEKQIAAAPRAFPGEKGMGSCP